MNVDIKNKAMVGEWLIEDVDIGKIKGWVYKNTKSIVWGRYLYWKNHLKLSRGLRTIETGCGYGRFSMMLGLVGEQVTLLDNNPLAVTTAVRAHQSIGLTSVGVTGDLLNLPDDLLGQFDVVCSFGTLEHFSGQYRLSAFQACANLLRQGGMIFFAVPNRYGIFYRLAFGLRKMLGLVSENFYEEPFSPAELKEIASHSGITLIELGCTGNLKSDFNYWIGENAKSLYRKLFRVKRQDSLTASHELDLKDLNFYGPIKDQRNYFDRFLTYNLLCVGLKR